ncbi:MAG: efflux RND transporter permease subunit [Planctomycetes bacterium]|nr:efflux RND transporter permease subunit [Planctomycetota bacterium]
MMRALVRAAIENPVAVHLGTLAMCAAGLLVGLSMPREVFPVFTMDRVQISAVLPGASPTDVERLVTLPIEEALAGTDGLDRISSISREGLSQVTLEVARDADTAEFLDEVRSRVQSGALRLPDECETPSVRELRTSFPAIAVAVHGEVDDGVLRDAARELQSELREFSGVGQVDVYGEREPRVWIEVEPDALAKYRLSLSEVRAAIAGVVRDMPAGAIDSVRGGFMVRVGAGADGAFELEQAVLRSFPDGRRLLLGQVARISNSWERAMVRSRYAGEPAVTLYVQKLSSADTIDLSEQVFEWIAAGPEVPKGVSVGAHSDVSVYVRNRLRTMQESALLGAALVLVSLIMFLSARVAFMTALGIPISFLGGILIAGSMGVTMNMIVMFGMIVVLGMIVDDAIVVGENVYRLMEEGLSPEDAAIEGASQVAKPVLATILTSIAAFGPILVMQGTTGAFLRPLPLIVSFCLIVSLFEALLILPVHLAFHAGVVHAAAGEGTRWYEPLRRVYQSFLRVCIERRLAVVTAAISVCGLLITFATSHMKFVLFDDFESKLIFVGVRMEEGVGLAETTRATREIERRVMTLPSEEMESIQSSVGIYSEDGVRIELAQNLAQVTVELSEGGRRERTTQEISDHIRALLEDPPRGVADITLGQPQAGPSGRAIDIWISGPDLAVLDAAAEDLKEVLATFGGVEGARDNVDSGKPQIELSLRDDARALGVSEVDLGGQLAAAFVGLEAARLRRGKDEMRVVVKLPETVREDPASMEALLVTVPSGDRVPLGTLAEISEGPGPVTIVRDKRERTVNVVADVDRDVTSARQVTAGLTEPLEDLRERYEGYRFEVRGDAEDTQETLDSLYKALIVSALLIYLILGTLFRSYAQPFVIMFIIPFGAMGMIFGHMVMDRSLGIMSLIGLLALSGIVVNDSLIFVDFVNRRRREGAKLTDALMDAGRVRFRPILLTSITTMLGLSPLAFFATGQARFLQPMAITLFFGLAVATGLVLILIPCTYGLLMDAQVLLKSPRAFLGKLFRGSELHPDGGGLT